LEPVTPPHASSSEKRQVGRAAGTVGFYTFLSRILGLVRDMVVARYFGSGMAADAFFVAFRIPNLLRRLFAEGSLSIAFIPVFTEYLQKKSREDALELARVVLTLLALVLAIVTIIGVLASPWIVRVQAFGFGGAGEKYELTVLLTRITFPYIFLISLVALFMGILNTLRHFAAPAAAPILLNVGIIAAVVWLSPHCSQPVIALAVGVIIGGTLQVLLQIPWLLKTGVSLQPRWWPGHPGVRRIGRLMLPAVFGSAVYQFNQFVGTLLASFLPEGSVSWLYYADRLVQFPLGIFAIAISTAALPSLSRQAAESGLHAFRETLEYSMRLVLFITLPAMTGLMVLGPLIIRVLFERGAFQATSTVMTTQALVFYCVGLWAFSGIRVLVAGFYALQDTKTPVNAAIIALVANIAFSLALMGPLRHGGLALALSLASSVQFAALAVFLRKQVPGWNLRAIARTAGVSVFASGIMAGGIAVPYRFWWSPGPQTGLLELVLGLCGLVALGAAIYFGVSRLLGSRELSSMLGLFLRKK
jgi:putative peptidoglycan lipid II flippase